MRTRCGPQLVGAGSPNSSASTAWTSAPCADDFMANPFFRVSPTKRQHSIDMLQRLIESAAAIGASLILIPILEVSEIREERESDELAAALVACLPAARAAKVRLGLETELPVARYIELVKRIGDEAVGAYYDIGNAAAQGYDCAADIRALGASIYGVHVKDRIREWRFCSARTRERRFPGGFWRPARYRLRAVHWYCRPPSGPITRPLQGRIADSLRT